MVTVFVPIGRTKMYFNIPGPKSIANPDTCIKKIGAGMIVVSSRTDNLNSIAISGLKIIVKKKFMFPDKMQKLFLHKHKG